MLCFIEGNSHIRRDCSETEVEDCDDFKNELQLPEEANCTFNSCEEGIAVTFT